MPAPLLSFSIVEPSVGSTVAPGQELMLKVELGEEIGVHEVRFFWYREGEVPVNAQHAVPDLVTTSSATPPFSGHVKVPIEAIGPMRLLAIGIISGGRLSGRSREEFDEVLLRVVPRSGLEEIGFGISQPWTLRTIGQVLEVPVFGVFSDGITRLIRGPQAGSRYQSSDDRVVRVYPEGWMRVVGEGETTLTVSNRGKTESLSVSVTVIGDEEPNGWPVADAGPDITVKSGKRVSLTGLKSMDPDGDPLLYEWTQVRGVTVALLDPGTASPSFVAPNVSAKRLLRFRLRVTDMAGADVVKGADSLPAFVNIWVVP